ncbi:cyclic AMP-responsive element-binding protein 3-like protein 1 isoform X2 [Rhinatrema bivittatum]|uniref:cyclic AMP-responsive element-binding protein 3-like protein 1 isoform X2 n=1 Tax=Rhinatrema bivittatum TaxID=194408 RepID=UPI00112B00A3|nr:cyclic AMP-responsive element-binding protein 3-like protein 1 isoform X2 [Rhinatrema bivittatum]
MDSMSLLEYSAFPADTRLFPTASFLDLEDLNEADFLNNVHFSENLDDFSNELFNSFFDEPLLVEKNSLLDMDFDPPTPGIQAEHSYSLSGDSAPQSPVMLVKTEENRNDLESSVWALEHELCSILVKREETSALEVPATQQPTSDMPDFSPLQRLPPPEEKDAVEMTPVPEIKVEPSEVNQFLNVATDDLVQMPLTPPSSHGSDSDGSQSPRSLPPSSPARPMARSSTAISCSPLLTAPHKLQGTSGPLILTEEEKRTLIAEGYPIPIKLPLTKVEEKALKRVRRKIKNKISAQESRRKKKEYVECLEKKTLLQQLQKLQALVTGKISRPYKTASTQTGTCLMVFVLCFVLVLGSLMPCFPEFSSTSQTVKTTPLPTSDIYTSSQVRSRSLLFYEEAEGTSQEGYSTLLDSWEPDAMSTEEMKVRDLPWTHEAAKYLSVSEAPAADVNQTGMDFMHWKEGYHKRESNMNDTTEIL